MTRGTEFYGRIVYILWTWMQDADVSGFACHYCSGSMKRRWPGWTAKELKQHLSDQDNAKDRELFLKWRDDDINYIRGNGYNSPSSRVGDNNLSKKVLRDKSDLMDLVVFERSWHSVVISRAPQP